MAQRGPVRIRLEQLGSVGRPLRLSEVRIALGISRGFLAKCVEAGTLRTGRVGREHRVAEVEVVRFAREELRLLE